DIATNSLILHLVAASLWAGGLFALLAHARRGGDYTDVAARRFSTVASICFVVMGFSGVINAIVRLPLDDVFTTTYGRLIVAKTVA
uniref:CopD family protein n=2 Tax=Bacillati TaxID=1783272 RepID=UPI0038B35416